MKLFNVLVAVALLVAAIIVLILKLFSPQPIQILLETGQEVATKGTDYFSIGTVMLLIVCSFVIGAAIVFLFYNSDGISAFKPSRFGSAGSAKEKESEHTHSHNQESSHDHSHGQAAYDLIMPLLREDEKKAVRIIRENSNEILQNDLVLKLGLSKVKTTRILASLERKDIITKSRHGMTNHIKLRH